MTLDELITEYKKDNFNISARDIDILIRCWQAAYAAAVADAVRVAENTKVELSFEQLKKSDTDYFEFNYGCDEVAKALRALKG